MEFHNQSTGCEDLEFIVGISMNLSAASGMAYGFSTDNPYIAVPSTAIYFLTSPYLIEAVFKTIIGLQVSLSK